MRLTVANLKPWLVTALVVLVILLGGGFYLTRTALRGPPIAGPTWAPAPSATPTSVRPSASRVRASPPRSRSSSSPSRTPPSSAATTTPAQTSPPPPVEVPHVLVAGPTIDNVYPHDSGCHIFWIATLSVRVTIVEVKFTTEPFITDGPQPSGSPRPMRADYVACDHKGPLSPVPSAGCIKGQVISADQACGVRFIVDPPKMYGTYQGMLSFGLSVLCTSAEVVPCAEIDSAHRPSADRPVYAEWSRNCQIQVFASRYDTGQVRTFMCDLGPA